MRRRKRYDSAKLLKMENRDPAPDRLRPLRLPYFNFITVTRSLAQYEASREVSTC